MKKKYKQDSIVYKTISWFFDISLLFYFCSFVLFNNDTLDLTGSDSFFRNISTLLVFFSGGLLAFVCENKKRVRPYKNKYLKGYVLFFLFCLVSTFWAIYPENSWALVMAMIRIILIAYFLSVRICSTQDVHHFMTIYVLMTLIRCIVVGVMMYGFYSSDFINQRFGYNFDYNPNETALFCVCSICFIVYSLSQQNTNRLIQLFDIVIALLFVIVIFLTQSRKGLVGLIAAPLLFQSFRGKTIIKYVLVTFSVAFIIIVLIPEELLSDITGGSIDRLTSLTGSNKDSSTDLREAYTNLAIEIWKSNPILGVGINNFAPLNTIEKNAYSHNNYVELLSGVGIVGFLLYYVPLFSLVIRKYKSDLLNLLKALIVVLLFLEVGNVTYQTFSFQCLYALFAVCVSLSIKQKNKQNNNE